MDYQFIRNVNHAEVIEMGVLGYSAEKHIQVIQDESFEAGYDKCEKDITELYDWLFENNRISDVQKANKDSQYRKKLFDEYVLASKK